MISRPCGPKSLMGLSRPWSRNCYLLYVGNDKILGMMLPKFLLIGELEIIGVLGLILFKRDWDRYRSNISNLLNR